MRRRAFALLAAGVAVAGCVPSGYTPPGSVPQVGPAPNSAPPPAGNRVGLLLPLTGPTAATGRQLLQAAQLAIELPGAPPVALDPQDTAGTAAGAANAAQQAIAAGDRLLIGPITAPETAAAAGAAVAASVPMLAFTSDPAQARPGVWTLGVTPDQQVRRLLAGAQAEQRARFAGLLPDDPLGQAMADALQRFAPGAEVRTYPSGSATALQGALADISDYAGRHGSETRSAPPVATVAPAAPKPPPRPARAPFRGLSPSGDVAPPGGTPDPPPGRLAQATPAGAPTAAPTATPPTPRFRPQPHRRRSLRRPSTPCWSGKPAAAPRRSARC